MIIWALRAPSYGDYDTPEQLKDRLDFLTNSVENGTSRFGWSWLDVADLNKLENKLEKSSLEIDFWKKGKFLKEIAVGDWVVHINLPYRGACIAGQVTETYSFEESNNPFEDYRHLIRINPSTVVKFERNDPRVSPQIYKSLVLQRRYWRIGNAQEFLKTIDRLRSGDFSKPKEESVGVFYLKQKLYPLLDDITKAIQETHPAKKLESFIAKVFRNVPRVTDVKENGSGYGTDYGADLIVTYESGLPIADLMKPEIIVVQIKSFINEHRDTDAVSQIETAIEKFQADSGLIITTAKKTEPLESAIKELSAKLGKPVSLLSGEDVAKFILTYGNNLLFQNQV